MGVTNYEFCEDYIYSITLVDTYDDSEIMVRYSKDMIGIKRQIVRAFKEENGSPIYNNDDDIVLYIRDKRFFTPEGEARLEAIENHPDKLWIDPDLIEERGIDFDLWHDYYLTDEEREAFDGFKVW